MIYRNRLPRASRYLPVLAAALAVMVFIPEGLIPGGNGSADTAEASDGGAEMPLVSIATAAPPVEELGLQRPGLTAAAPQPKAVAVVQPDVSVGPDQPANTDGAKVAEAGDAFPTPVTDAGREPVPVKVATLDAPAGPDVTPAAAAAAPSEGRSLAAVGAEPPAATGGSEMPSATAAAQTKVAQVGNVALNARSGPSTSNARLFVLKPGEQVTVAEVKGGWARVVRENGESGWAYSSYLSGPEELDRDRPATRTASRQEERRSTAVEAPRRQQQARAERAAPDRERQPTRPRYARIGSDIPARAGPSRNSPRLFVLPAGERVAIAEMRDGWAHVVLDGGVSGWVRYR